MRKWPPCCSLVISVRISLYVHSLCEFSSDEEVATLLFSSSVSLYYFICICLSVSLEMMRSWPPCSSLVLCIVVSRSLCMYLSLCKYNSGDGVATLLIFSSSDLQLSPYTLYVDLGVIREMATLPLCSSICLDI